MGDLKELILKELNKLKEVEKLFDCSKCDKKYIRSEHLRRHEKTHDDDTPFKCSKCDKTFKILDYLRKHEKVHTSERPFSCSECGQKYKMMEHLKRHHRRAHSGILPYDCSTCDKKFKMKEDLREHEISHTSERAFSCSKCDKKFKALNHLRRHEKGHSYEKSLGMSESKNTLTDNLTSSSEVLFREEPFRHSDFQNKDVQPLSCSKCHLTFSKLDSLNRHLSRPPVWCKSPTVIRISKENEVEPEENQKLSEDCREKEKLVKTAFNCLQCNKEFMQASDLKSHEQSHLNLRPFACSTCDKKFMDKKHLRRHQTVHTGEKPFRCTNCDTRFTRSDVLKRHKLYRCTGKDSKESEEAKPEKTIEMVSDNSVVLKSQPTLNQEGGALPNAKPRAFSCLQCNVEFRQASDLKRHEQSHLNIRSFACSKCGKKFNRFDHLQRHEKSHSNIRPFSCVQCPSKFKLAQDLKRHQGTCHSGHAPLKPLTICSNADKQFSCTTCGKTFRRFDHLKRHEKSHSKNHSIRPFSSFTEHLLKRQEKLNSNDRPFGCSTCDWKFKLAKDLRRHEKIHTKGTSVEDTKEMAPGHMHPVNTSIENLEYESMLEPIVEIKVEADEEPAKDKINGISNIISGNDSSKLEYNSVICAHCDKMFAHISVLRMHEKFVHPEQPQSVLPNPKPYEPKKDSLVCLECDKNFLTEDHFKDHKLVHELQRKLSEQSKVEKYQETSTSLQSEVIVQRYESSEKSVSESCVNEQDIAPVLKVKVVKNNGTKIESPNEYTCPHCDKNFKYERELNRHQITHSDIKPFSCSDCDVRFKRLDSLNRHQRSVHEDEMPYICPEIADDKTSNPIRKSNRLEAKLDEKILAFEESFFNEFSLKNEEKKLQFPQNETANSSKEKDIDSDTKLKCSHCDKRFRYEGEVKRHELTHTNERPFSCQVCDMKFKDSGTRNRHERNLHSTLTPSEFLSIESSSAFVDYESPRLSKRLKMTAMYKESQVQENDESHVEADEEETQSLQHDHENSSNKKGIHLKNKLKCSHCGKKFKYERDVKRHELTHTNERPFSCNVCDMKFKDSWTRKRHERRRHSEIRPSDQSVSKEESHLNQSISVDQTIVDCETPRLSKRLQMKALDKESKPQGTEESLVQSNVVKKDVENEDKHSCTECGKSCRSEYDLKRHLLTHSKVKPYSCLLCDAKFTRGDSLTKHLKIYHKDVPSIFPKVDQTDSQKEEKPLTEVTVKQENAQNEVAIKKEKLNDSGWYSTPKEASWQSTVTTLADQLVSVIVL